MAEQEPARGYKTPAERRQAGVRNRISDWLTVFGLLEIESFSRRLEPYDEPTHDRESLTNGTIQLGAEITSWPWGKLELLYEYDHETRTHKLDEAIAAVEIGDFELELGKLYLPFGEYYSHFVSGPLLEFGEIRDYAAILNHDLHDRGGRWERLELSLFVYQGQTNTGGSRGSKPQWGLALRGSPFEHGTLGAGYLSDLSAFHEQPPIDGVNSQRRVAAVNTYAALTVGHFEMTAEAVWALDAIAGLDPEVDTPWAWNLELAYSPRDELEWALRLERSGELEDAPKYQGGLAVFWRFTKNASLTLEYLQGSYELGVAEDPQGRELEMSRALGAQLSVGF